MKSISKKIKTIYLLAMMAILSICIAVFPVFKTETVKAEEDPGLSMNGAYVRFSKTDKADDFALMFQAKITKAFYDTIADQDVKFGMAIFPDSETANVTDYASLLTLKNSGKAEIFDSLIGTASSSVGQKSDLKLMKQLSHTKQELILIKTTLYMMVQTYLNQIGKVFMQQT